MFIKSTLVDGFNQIDIVNAYFLGAYANNRTVFPMSIVQSPTFSLHKPGPENPKSRHRGGPVGIWDFGQRREDGRVENMAIKADKGGCEDSPNDKT